MDTPRQSGFAAALAYLKPHLDALSRGDFSSIHADDSNYSPGQLPLEQQHLWDEVYILDEILCDTDCDACCWRVQDMATHALQRITDYEQGKLGAPLPFMLPTYSLPNGECMGVMIVMKHDTLWIPSKNALATALNEHFAQHPLATDDTFDETLLPATVGDFSYVPATGEVDYAYEQDIS